MVGRTIGIRLLPSLAPTFSAGQTTKADGLSHMRYLLFGREAGGTRPLSR
jgi:hypothetical protein